MNGLGLLTRRIFVFALFSALIFGAVGPEHLSAKRKKKSRVSTKTLIHRDRTTKEAELSKLHREIAKVQAQLIEHEKKEKASKKNIGAFNKRTAQLRQIMSALQAKADALAAEQEEVDHSIVKTKSDLDSLKRAYAGSVRNFYLHGGAKPPIAMTSALIAGSGQSLDLSQARDREEYYAHIVGEAHSMGHARLDSSRLALVDTKQAILATLNQQQILLDRRAEEQSNLEIQKQSEQQRLAQIQADKSKLEQELRRRKASARKLEGIIANLVAKEEASTNERKRRATGHKGKKKQPVTEAETPESADLPGTSHPHSLQWPTASHQIKQGFGEHRNRELKTVTINLGIDIAATIGSSVVSAAEGVVSLVSSLPGYGVIVVIRHPGNLHTVYADLGSATVARGAHVRPGSRIGRSGTSEELGPSVHFEVWKGRSKQNPAGWLR